MRAVLAVALVALASASVFAADKPEPRYEGKPLEYWVTRFQKAETDDQRKAAVEALIAFGTDAAPAVPALIEMLSDLSLDYRTQVIDMIDILAAIGPKAKDARPIIVKLIKDKKTKATPFDKSIAAIVAISTEPKDAVPVLIPLLDVTDVGGEAYWALCEIGPDAREAIPAIRKYALKRIAAQMKEEKPYIGSLNTLHQLGPDIVPLLVELFDAHGGYGRDVAFRCLEELGPQAKKAVPALVKFLKHGDPVRRLQAARSLWKIEVNPAVVAALAELATTDPKIVFKDNFYANQEDGVAISAVKILGEIGPDAKAALPQLRAIAAVGSTFWLFSDGSEALFPAPVVPQVVPATYYPVVGRPTGPGVSGEEYRNARARIEVARAAFEAIAKIEGKPKK
jgi:HEAT repeat protein